MFNTCWTSRTSDNSLGSPEQLSATISKHLQYLALCIIPNIAAQRHLRWRVRIGCHVIHLLCSVRLTGAAELYRLLFSGTPASALHALLCSALSLLAMLCARLIGSVCRRLETVGVTPVKLWRLIWRYTLEQWKGRDIIQHDHIVSDCHLPSVNNYPRPWGTKQMLISLI